MGAFAACAGGCGVRRQPVRRRRRGCATCVTGRDLDDRCAAPVLRRSGRPVETVTRASGRSGVGPRHRVGLEAGPVIKGLTGFRGR